MTALSERQSNTQLSINRELIEPKYSRRICYYNSSKNVNNFFGKFYTFLTSYEHFNGSQFITPNLVIVAGEAFYKSVHWITSFNVLGIEIV